MIERSLMVIMYSKTAFLIPCPTSLMFTQSMYSISIKSVAMRIRSTMSRISVESHLMERRSTLRVSNDYDVP